MAAEKYTENENIRVFSTQAHPAFAKLVAQHLGKTLSKCNNGKFANGETKVDICQSVRASDVYIVSTGSGWNGGTLNDALMELLIMSYTCKTSSCKSVIGVIPYLPYSQQSKLNLIVSITKTILYSVI